MSKKIKDEQKKFLGETLNQYDKALDEAINQLDKKNREQNHKISSLVNSFDNEYLEKDVEGNMTTLENSKDGMVIINEIQGNTEVNYCKDGEKELILNGDIDTQGESSVTITEGVDGGLVDVVIEGNTEINMSNTKDPVMITHMFDEFTNNGGKLQTTVDDVTTYDSMVGKVDIKNIKGDTLVNHAVNGNEELILNGNIDVSGDNFITINTNCAEGGKVDVALEGNTLVNVSKTKDTTPITKEGEDVTGNHVSLVDEGSIRPVLNGNTMVNVCDQKDPVAITKSYTVETGNHVALQGEYDGKCRPVVTGNTLVNLVSNLNKKNFFFSNGGSYENNIVTSPNGWCCLNLLSTLKTSTKYTIIFNYISDTSTNKSIMITEAHSSGAFSDVPGQIKITSLGKYIYSYTTRDSFDDVVFTLRTLNEGDGEASFSIMILEGDYTNTNKPIPDDFEGLQSSFEDKVVTQEMVDTGEELAENLGKYKVDYVVTGKNLLKITSNQFIKGFNAQGFIRENDYCTDFIPFNIPSPYYGQRDNLVVYFENTNLTWCNAVYYNAEKNIVGGSYQGGSSYYKYITMHSGHSYEEVKYVKISCNNANDLDNMTAYIGKELDCYEDVKSYTKTFYLNSPLLEGDTIEQQGNNVVHVHRYGKVVLDGSDDEGWTESIHKRDDYYRVCFNIGNYSNPVICDKIVSKNVQGLDEEGISLSGVLDVQIANSRLSEVSVNGFKAWLQSNPMTVVAKLRTPQYEVISQNDTILCDSYVNGHLDVDSVVPIEKIDFRAINMPIKYLYPSTEYIIQFESDNVGKIDLVTLNSYAGVSSNYNVIKGINKLNITTFSESVDNGLIFYGIGFNASNIVVTPAIEQDFDYFSDMQSCFEDNLVTEGENAGKYEVSYVVTGKNKLSNINNTDNTKFYIGNSIIDNDINNLIKLQPNTSYIFSTNNISSNSYLSVYNSRREKKIDIFAVLNTVKFTTPNEECFFHIYATYREPITNLQWQLEEGDTATTYEPYKEPYTKTLYLNSPLLEGDTIEEKDNGIYHVHRTELIAYTEGDETSLITDKVNTLHQLETPTYELIEQSNLVIPSYVNGHLDFNTAVPVSKVNFLHFEEELTYLYPSTSYTLQFVSDKEVAVNITLGGTSLLAQNIVTGLNRISITTPETLVNNKLVIDGIGAKISKIVVTNTDREFKYFEGMKSVGECEELEIKSNNKNLFTSEVIDALCTLENWVGNGAYRNNYVAYNLMNFKNGITYTNTIPSITVPPNFYGILVLDNTKNGNFLQSGLYKNETSTEITVSSQKSTFSPQSVEGSFKAFLNYEWTDEGMQKLRRVLEQGIQTEIGNVSTDYIKPKSNIQQLTHEPLRAVGDAKDRYVLIDGKWYIERKCRKVVFDGSDVSKITYYPDNSTNNTAIFTIKVDNGKNGGLCLCDKFINFSGNIWNVAERNDKECISSTVSDLGIILSISKYKLSSVNPDGLGLYLQSNPIIVVYELQTPTYEPINYIPLEVYSGITHITTNSAIPTNIIIKNHGYNLVALKENTQYTLYVDKNTTNALTYRLGDYVEINSLSKFTFTTPATLTDKTLRITGKGNSVKDLMLIEGTPANDPVGYFDGLKSSYECEKVTDESDENYGKYKAEVIVKCLDDELFESKQTVYLNSPLLKGDEIVWKDNKLQHYHIMGSVVLDGSEDEDWKIIGDSRLAYLNISDRIQRANAIMCDSLKTTIVTGDVNNTKLGIYMFPNGDGGSQIRIRLTTSDTVDSIKQYLQFNPTTVVYQLATPYYEEISPYPLKFNTKENCSLTTESNIQVTQISFNIYEETLAYLYPSTKYYVSFNADISREIVVDLGGTKSRFTTQVGYNKIEITTPADTTNMLTFNGQGINIDHVMVTRQDIDEYFEGMKSVGECENNTLEIICKNNDNSKSNTQTLTHEPLRAVGDIKDRYVLIDGKWYIERNTAIGIIDGTSQARTTLNYLKDNEFIMFTKRSDHPVKIKDSNVVSDFYKTYKNWSTMYHDTSGEGISSVDSALGIGIRISNSKTGITSNDDIQQLTEKLLNYFQANPVKVIYQLDTPTYEPIDYNPFEVYSDITHISNNSLIPCNMVIKNHGYNCILKPSTTYTIALNKPNGTISAKLGGSAKVDSTNSVFTITTPSTLNDNVLRLSGSGNVKDIMILEGDKTVNTPSYFEGIESVFEQEYDTEKGKYRVTAKVIGNGKESSIVFYINEPLRSVNGVKDKIFIQDNKVVVQRNCTSYTFDGSDDEIWVVEGLINKTLSCSYLYAKIKLNLCSRLLQCDTLPVTEVYNIDVEGIDIHFNLGLHARVHISRLATQDSAGFKQWLQQNPVTVVYELAEPVYELADCDLSKLVLENYENSSLIFESNIPVSANIRYSGEVPVVTQAKSLSSQVDNTTLDINENIIPYMCDIDYRIVELQLMNGDTQGEGIELLGIGDIEILGNENVLFNNREDKKYNYSYDMLKRDILSQRYSKEEYQYRLDRYLLANKISDEEYKELEGLLNNGE